MASRRRLALFMAVPLFATAMLTARMASHSSAPREEAGGRGLALEVNVEGWAEAGDEVEVTAAAAIAVRDKAMSPRRRPVYRRPVPPTTDLGTNMSTSRPASPATSRPARESDADKSAVKKSAVKKSAANKSPVPAPGSALHRDCTIPPRGGAEHASEDQRRFCPRGCWAGLPPRTDLLTIPCIASAIAETAETVRGSQVHITHVVNPFPGAESKDQQYAWTLKAIDKAVRYAARHGIIVEVLAVHFSDEAVDVSQVAGARSVPLLCPWRKAHCVVRKRWQGLTEGETPIPSPLVPDVWHLGYAQGRGELFAYTNFDIILREDFYVVAKSHIDNTKGVVALDNLRRDMIIPKDQKVSDWSVEQVFKWPTTHDHPGHDCFVFPRSWIPCLQLSDFVLGIGSWGITALKELRYLATAVGGRLDVRTLHITRHLGHKGFDKRFHGGTPWKKSHQMQVRHNYWQYAKATHRWKHEMKANHKLIDTGVYTNFSKTNPGVVALSDRPIDPASERGKCRALLTSSPRRQHPADRAPAPAAVVVGEGIPVVRVRRLLGIATGSYVASTTLDAMLDRSLRLEVGDNGSETEGQPPLTVELSFAQLRQRVLPSFANGSSVPGEQRQGTSAVTPWWTPDCPGGRLPNTEPRPPTPAPDGLVPRAIVFVVRNPFAAVWYALETTRAAQSGRRLLHRPNEALEYLDEVLETPESLTAQLVFHSLAWATAAADWASTTASMPADSVLLIRYEDLDGSPGTAEAGQGALLRSRRMLLGGGGGGAGQEDAARCAFLLCRTPLRVEAIAARLQLPREHPTRDGLPALPRDWSALSRNSVSNAPLEAYVTA